MLRRCIVAGVRFLCSRINSEGDEEEGEDS